MTALAVVSAALLAASVIGFAVWLWRRMKKLRHLPAGRVFVTMGFGGVAAGASVLLETWALRFADVSLYASAGHGLAAALAMILFCAPLEEGLKALSVWPLYLNRRLVAGQVGAFYAVMAAAGFSAVEVIQTRDRSLRVL
jgi:RsiW-degrading membrane proteinase PrsW (M82 family)